jgi:hypothetical protein
MMRPCIASVSLIAAMAAFGSGCAFAASPHKRLLCGNARPNRGSLDAVVRYSIDKDFIIETTLADAIINLYPTNPQIDLRRHFRILINTANIIVAIATPTSKDHAKEGSAIDVILFDKANMKMAEAVLNTNDIADHNVVSVRPCLDDR